MTTTANPSTVHKKSIAEHTVHDGNDLHITAASDLALLTPN